jgi:tellurite resistance protein
MTTDTTPRPQTRVRPPLNVFGIAFGLSGLAGTWNEAARSLGTPQLVAELLWGVALAAWLTTVVVYVSRLRGVGDLRDDLDHPVLSPFAALVPIPPMLFASYWVPQLPWMAWVVGVAVVASALVGFRFISRLLAQPLGFDKVHSGYFLPTVAGALLAAQSLATIGQPALATGAFGVGILFWLLIGGAVVARLLAGPEQLGTLMPTLAIFSAPPAVAGNAWWVINGGSSGVATEMLAGTMVALVAPHLFLLRRYLRLPFTIGFWAFTFTVAASATFGLRLLSLDATPLAFAGGVTALAVATIVIGAIAARSVWMLARSR